MSHPCDYNIAAWAKSKFADKAPRALALFREMRALHSDGGDDRLKPNVVAYNAVLNACAFTDGDAFESNKAVEIAQATLKDLEQSRFGKPDQVTYGTFLRMCGNQVPPCESREKLVALIFKKCMKDGQVGNLVLQQLSSVGSEELYFALIGVSSFEEVKLSDLPKEWRENVVEGKWRRKKWRVNSVK